MQIVPTTFLGLALAALICLVGPRRGLVFLACTLPAGAAAAFNLPALSNASILLTDLLVVVIAALFLLYPKNIFGALSTVKPVEPGFLLVLTFALAAITSVFGPRLFAGTLEVFGIVRVDGVTGIILRPLRPSGANTTQLFRFALGVLTFIVIATLMRQRPDNKIIITTVACATTIHVLLGFADVGTYLTGTKFLLDPIRTANYSLAINQELAGIKRMVGGFPEASAFGYLTLGLFGFWVRYVFAGGKWRPAVLFLIATGIVLLWSASTSAYVAAAVLVFVLGLGATLRFISSKPHARQSKAAVWVVMGALIIVPAALFSLFALYQTQPWVSAFFDRLLFDKLESDSGVERMSWNVQAFRNFLETYMFGAGMGSIRASSWIIANLASIGLIGTIAFLAFVGSIWNIRSRSGDRERDVLVEALKAGCLGLLIRALITKATPNLEIVFFLMAGLAVGLARTRAIERTPTRTKTNASPEKIVALTPEPSDSS